MRRAKDYGISVFLLNRPGPPACTGAQPGGPTRPDVPGFAINRCQKPLAGVPGLSSRSSFQPRQIPLGSMVLESSSDSLFLQRGGRCPTSFQLKGICRGWSPRHPREPFTLSCEWAAVMDPSEDGIGSRSPRTVLGEASGNGASLALVRKF